MKTCPRCNIEKSLSLFWVDRSKASGFASHCADCKKEYQALYRENNPQVGQKHQAYLRTHQKNRARANDKISNGVARGEIQRQSCEICGDSKADAHHQDYDKPLDVNWLCRRHHRQLHAGIIEL